MVESFEENMTRLANTQLGESIEPVEAAVHIRFGDALLGGRDEGIGLSQFIAYSRLKTTPSVPK